MGSYCDVLDSMAPFLLTLYFSLFVKCYCEDCEAFFFDIALYIRNL